MNQPTAYNPGTAELYTCPEGGFGHGYSTEPFTCEGDYHPPMEAVSVMVKEVDGEEKLTAALDPTPPKPES